MAAEWWNTLISDGGITANQLIEAEMAAGFRGITMEDAVVQLGFLHEEQLFRAKAAALGIQWVKLDDLTILGEVLELVPSSVAHENCCFPIGIEQDRLLIAVVDPLDAHLIEKLEFITIRKITPVMSSHSEIKHAITRHYAPPDSGADCVSYERPSVTDEFKPVDEISGFQALDDRSPIAKLFQLILSESVRMEAADIHIEPFADRFRVRYRIEGRLVERDAPPIRIFAKLIERIMHLAKLDPGSGVDFAEGRFVAEIEGIKRECNVRFLPTRYGQSVVLCLSRQPG